MRALRRAQTGRGRCVGAVGCYLAARSLVLDVEATRGAWEVERGGGGLR